MSSPSGIRNVVLVHGGFVDGSGWEGVHDALTADGYRVAVTQHPTLSLEDDAAVTRRAIESLDGPVVLVGHSYGGAVITEAGACPPPRPRSWPTPRSPGRQCPRRDRHRGRLAGQAQLVPGRHRRQDDPPPAQRSMAERTGATVTEVPGSHSIYVSQP